MSQEEKDKIKEYQKRKYQKLIQYKKEALKQKRKYQLIQYKKEALKNKKVFIFFLI